MARIARHREARTKGVGIFLTGSTLEQMWGWGWTSTQHPKHVDRVIAKIRHCFAAAEAWEDTFPLLQPILAGIDPARREARL